jgi:uncharacterized membrane protein
MIELEHTLILPRPVEEVFSFLNNFEHDPSWQAGIIEAKQVPEGAARLGTIVKQVRRFMGRRLDYTGEVVDHEEPKKIWVKSVSGPYPFEGGYRLEPTDGGTRLTLLLKVTPTGIIRFTQSMVARELRQQMEADSNRLKALLNRNR